MDLMMKKSLWLLLVILPLYFWVPSLVGAMRLISFITGKPFELVLALHIVSSLAFAFSGAVLFLTHAARFKWHQTLGKLAWLMALLATLSGVWLSLFYARGEFDSLSLLLVRVLVAATMLWCLLQGLRAVLRRQFRQHKAHMLRVYALGMGAMTQVFMFIPWLLWPQIQGELARTLLMALGWLINWQLAQWWIKRHWQSEPLIPRLIR